MKKEYKIELGGKKYFKYPIAILIFLVMLLGLIWLVLRLYISIKGMIL